MNSYSFKPMPFNYVYAVSEKMGKSGRSFPGSQWGLEAASTQKKEKEGKRRKKKKKRKKVRK